MITVEYEVNVSSKRLDLIHSIASVVAKDLNITEMTVNVCSSTEMYGCNAEGLCGGTDSIDIINKRDPRDLFMVIAHELRHSYQWLNNMFVDDNRRMEVDAYGYEGVAFDKLYKGV